jgi:hypothetical protein
VHLARTRHAWALTLLARGRPADVTAAAELLAAVRATAHDVGSAVLERRAAAALETGAPAG